jgi:AraC family transcriptional regulator
VTPEKNGRFSATSGVLLLGNRRASPFVCDRALAGRVTRVEGEEAGRRVSPVRINWLATQGVAMATVRARAGIPEGIPDQPTTTAGMPVSRRIGPPRHGVGDRAGKPVLAPWQIKLATHTMRIDLDKPISVRQLAQLCGLSLCYFVRAFSNTVGIAPYAWFVEQRICRAKNLLSSTDLSLAQIALECGFSDQAHFTKAFGKATGLTPARWRRAPMPADAQRPPRGSISAFDRSMGSTVGFSSR